MSSCSSARGPVAPSVPLIAFLERVQEAALSIFGASGFDPKRYVDLSLKSDLPAAERAFDELRASATAQDWETFIRSYFEDAGGDLEHYEPPDYTPEPEGFLPAVKSREMREWALEVHALWKSLSRKISDGVRTRPDSHTLIPVPNPLVIPGSRFREAYYWDSYWVIRGLLASKMYETAKAVVKNLIYLANRYGYVLNGARAYYTNRSQPPLLSAMVREIYDATHDLELVKISLQALLNEYEFWNSGKHKVTIQDAEGRIHTLSRYYAKWDKPRPESSTTDKESASKLSSASEKANLYWELASAAESGWDFSARWMRDPLDFTTMAATSVLPVDLNAFILGMEHDIAFFAEVIGDKSTFERFVMASEARKEAITSIFWNEQKGQWLDYWLNYSNSCSEPYIWDTLNQNQNVYASNFVPLWINPFYSDASMVHKVVNSLKHSGLLQASGIATSLQNSGQQWDFPNGWAPLQHMIVEGLVKSGSTDARQMAEDIAARWIRTNYAAYKQTGKMHEKYNVVNCGEFGGGGEYVPQTGFGWSNGVVLAFLEEFGWPQDREIIDRE
ncbi:probable trehalase isoform X2 [Punica granatum]|uniref:Trehalase n=1 Tax=Punica granatum TaxID=22663 RepID=A0A6P8CWT2_PUNGR|nr:probable trehalase isoform X2 [Punica granatum]